MSDPRDILVSVERVEWRTRRPRTGPLRRGATLHSLRGVDLSVARGETLCLLGESGCGADALARIVMGLISPVAGKVLFEGVRIDDMGVRRRKPYQARMAMVFADPETSLSPRRRVFDTVAEPLRHLKPGLAATHVRARVESAIQEVGGEPGWLALLPHQLAPADRQRVAIARALVTEPDVLVADDPSAALDPSVRGQILGLIHRICIRKGLTCLFFTGDPSVALQIADRVAVMYLGQVMEIAPAGEILARPRHPYTRRLFEAVPKLTGAWTEVGVEAEALPDPTAPPPGCPFAPRCAEAEERCRRERPSVAEIGASLAACHAVEEGRAPWLAAQAVPDPEPETPAADPNKVSDLPDPDFEFDPLAFDDVLRATDPTRFS